MSEKDTFQDPETVSLLRNFHQLRIGVYFADFLIAVSLAWFFYIVSVKSAGAPLQFASLAAACLLMYRSIYFTHELAHQKFRFKKEKTFRVFYVAWHVLCGIPMLAPGFLYHDLHLEHHSKQLYNNPNDGEYERYGSSSPWLIVKSLVGQWAVGLLSIPRFSILTPVSFLFPKLRKRVEERMSFMGLYLEYRRKPPSEGVRAVWLAEELIACLFVNSILFMVFSGRLSGQWIIHWLIITEVSLTLNYFRALTAHRYRGTGEVMSFNEHILDSVTVAGNPFWTELWAPVGIRYHSLHHWFPQIPYCHLSEAHQTLMQKLPENHPYRKTIERSFFSAMSRLIKDGRSAQAA